MRTIEGLETGPDVSTQDIEAIMDAGYLTEPILLDTESTHAASATVMEPILLNTEPTHVASATVTEPILLDTESTHAASATVTEPILLDTESTHTVSAMEPIFLDSEPMRAGRKRKAKDMSGLRVCFCGEHAKPDKVDSI